MRGALCFICLITMLGCKNEPVSPRYPDPIAQSFWGRKVNLMREIISEQGLIDSIFFDSAGNVVLEKSHGLVRKTEYDSLHFPIRQLTMSEFRSSYLIKYTYEENVFVQHWLETADSTYRENTVDENLTEERRITYELDRNGYVLQSKDSKSGNRTVYKYDESMLLLSKITYQHQNGKELEKWVYTYKDKRLLECENHFGGLFYKKYFFSESGLIDSAIYKQFDVIKYDYKFW
ncbi:MAG TPA: hypothetical protein VGD65_03270 [Chryseosolibacter sp.]